MRDTMTTSLTGGIYALAFTSVSFFNGVDVTIRILTGLVGLAIAIATLVTLLRKMPEKRKKHEKHTE